MPGVKSWIFLLSTVSVRKEGNDDMETGMDWNYFTRWMDGRALG